MSDPVRFVGLDVGGTAIKVGAVSVTGQILFRDSEPLAESRDLESLLASMTRLAQRAGVQDQLGVGIAGLVDRAAGKVEVSPNLAAIEGVELRKLLAERLGLDESRLALENDANTAAFGEVCFGAAEGRSSALMVTLGTGIGGGLVQDGQLVRGDGGMAGELGHLVVDPEGPPCGCGSLGCVETLASGSAAIRRSTEAGLPRSSPGDVAQLCQEAREGDTECLALLERIGCDLGFALAAVLTLLDVRTFVIGGGFGAARDLLEAGIRRGLEERSFHVASRSVSILSAKLGADAGWIGAARLAVQDSAPTDD